MKKNILSLAALLIASATVFTACSSDDNIISEQPAQPTDKYTMTINASKGDGATNRALSLSSSTLNAAWAAGEQVTVYNNTKSAALGGHLEAKSSGTNTTLTGELTGTVENGDELTLKFLSPTYGTQDGTLTGSATSIDKVCDYAEASVTVSSVAGGNITTTTAATFENKQSIVKFTLKDKGNSSAAINATQLVVSDGTNSYTVTPASGTDVLYVALPDISSKTLTLTAADGTYSYVYEKSNVTFDNGKYYEITVKMTNESDLSMVDNAGNVRDKQWTANCYMVHTAGNYKLPLVYGNAIKDGAANTTAYNPGGSTNDTYCANFVNHAGTAINAPWITKSADGTGADKGMGITVASAALLWQDAEGLITAVGISGDYLTLTVGKDAATQQGNALVAAKTSDGTIVWSWHIWVTTETFATLTTVATGSHDYQVTPVNLGWVPTGGDGKQGYNTYYQWGRKDAFIPGTWNASTDRTVYDISNATVTGLTYTASTTAAIADNIKNPTTHYYNSSTSGPCTSKYYNMWDAQQTGTGHITTATVKTVYDPCPAGFCVPTGNLYYFMSSGNSRYMTTWDSTNKGATWNISTTGTDLFFPASGYRYYSSGSLYYVGSFGYFWSASPNSSNNGRHLGFNSSYWYWNYGTRADGFPVRAVAEE